MKILKKILIINFLVLCFFVNINVFAFEVKFNSRIYADMDVPRITNSPSDLIVTSIKKNAQNKKISTAKFYNKNQPPERCRS